MRVWHIIILPNYWLHAITGEQLYRSKRNIDKLKIIIIVIRCVVREKMIIANCFFFFFNSLFCIFTKCCGPCVEFISGG